jgi:hypothetical protein
VGYQVITVTPEFRAQFEPRGGLEGPFFYPGNRVLYYCNATGEYLNPLTDIFLTHEEYQEFAK